MTESTVNGYYLMHTHKCSVCKTEWKCDDPQWKNRSFVKCGISESARVNGDGPYCEPCRRAEMIARYKEHRKLPYAQRKRSSFSYEHPTITAGVQECLALQLSKREEKGSAPSIEVVPSPQSKCEANALGTRQSSCVGDSGYHRATVARSMVPIKTS